MADSDEYTTDEGKRKKSTGKLEEYFGRTTKSRKSPEKRDKMEETLSKIMKMIDDFRTDIKQDLQNIREEQKDFWKEVKEIKEENEFLKKENNEVKKELQLLKGKIDLMDKEKRRNNIIIQGIPITTYEEGVIKERMNRLLKDNLELEVKIKNARKIGEKICLLEMENNTDKQLVMSNKSKLKNIKDTKIYINNDMNLEEREIQKIIRDKAKNHREKGETVKIGYQKLIINGEVRVWNNEKKTLVTKTDNKPKNS